MKRTFTKRELLVAGILALGLVAAIAGCDAFSQNGQTTGAATPPTTPAADMINIGVLLPLSGEAAAYGLPAQSVLTIAAKEINDAGGIGGKMINLVSEDGQCGSEPANKATNDLVSLKKVSVIIGGFCSSETLAAAPIVQQNKVVLLSPGSSSPAITAAGDYIFRNYPSDTAQGQILAEYAKKAKYKKVGIIAEEQPYTEGIADTFTADFKNLGGTTMVEKYAQDASDFRTQITKLQGGKVDAFFIDPQTPAKAGLIVKQLQEAGIKGPFIMNDVALDAQKEVVEPYKDYVEGSVGAEVPYDKMNPELPKLQAAYKAANGGADIPYMSYMAPTYDSLYIIKEAIAKVGYSGEKIRSYLYTVKGRKGLAGTLSFDVNGDPDKSYRHVARMIKGGMVVDMSK